MAGNISRSLSRTVGRKAQLLYVFSALSPRALPGGDILATPESMTGLAVAPKKAVPSERQISIQIAGEIRRLLINPIKWESASAN